MIKFESIQKEDQIVFLLVLTVSAATSESKTDIFNKYLAKDGSMMMRSDPKQHQREEVEEEEEEEERLFLLAEQTEAFLLVFLSFAWTGLGCHRGHGGRQRLSACGGRGRAMAAGSDLQLVARHGCRDGRDPCVHLLLEGKEKERRRGRS